MTRVVAFDVNETLLDLSALDKPFENLFGESALRTQWFALMLQLSFVGGLTGSYVDFSTAQRAALHMLGRVVAAHAWDVSGALLAGCEAAFVSRPGMVPSPLGPQPDIVERDVAAVVDRIIKAAAC